MKNRQIAFHILGLACLGMSVLISTLSFSLIVTQGYVLWLEPRLWILYPEMVLASVSVIYLGYQYMRFISSATQ
ncbi:MAG: hypothetical protein ABSB71_08085 [Candidatus Bathyarchaeia archaeon]|jgi:hypothetical protein